MNTNIVFSVQVIPDRFQLFEVNKDAILQKILPDLLKTVKNNADLKDYRVLVAHQLVAPESEISDLAMEESAPQATQVLREESAGFYLLFIESPKSSTKLEISLSDGVRVKILDGQEEYLIGRRDEPNKIFPDIDLSTYLGQNELKVSREQAVVCFANEKWKLKLHENAKTTLFLDQEKLEKNREYEIRNEVMLCFGNNPDNPFLRLRVRVIAS